MALERLSPKARLLRNVALGLVGVAIILGLAGAPALGTVVLVVGIVCLVSALND